MAHAAISPAVMTGIVKNAKTAAAKPVFAKLLLMKNSGVVQKFLTHLGLRQHQQMDVGQVVMMGLAMTLQIVVFLITQVLKAPVIFMINAMGHVAIQKADAIQPSEIIWQLLAMVTAHYAGLFVQFKEQFIGQLLQL
ncbi:MAG: hypothetical protein PHP01_02260 [Phycisphaerae bacterium]|nr:hypothetical protein [Phycisphaerae bacterium]